MALCLSACFKIDSVVQELIVVAILPVTLMYSSFFKEKMNVFFSAQLVSVIGFIVSAFGIASGNESLAVIAFFIALPLRQVQFPFHSWIKDIESQKDLYPSFLYMILTQSGFVIYSQHLFGNESSAFITLFIPLITLVTGLLSSVAALRSSNILTRHLLLVLSQSCLPLAAYHSYNHTSATGGIMFSLLLCISGGMFGLIAFHIYKQKGIIDLSKYYSLHRCDKSLGFTYLISGLSIVGLPFTMGYIAEDILFHGLIQSNPALATIYIFMTAINGFTVYKTFSHLFFGHTQEKWIPMYFQGLNRKLMKFSIIIIVLGGLFSGTLASKIETRLVGQDYVFSQK
jgi:NADH:ubiquinone oxidoreductase subunit 4 (subunit M)